MDCCGRQGVFCYFDGGAFGLGQSEWRWLGGGSNGRRVLQKYLLTDMILLMANLSIMSSKNYGFSMLLLLRHA